MDKETLKDHAKYFGGGIAVAAGFGATFAAIGAASVPSTAGVGAAIGAGVGFTLLGFNTAFTVLEGGNLSKAFSHFAGSGALATAAIALAIPSNATSTAEAHLEETTPATTLIIDGQQDIQTFMGANSEINSVTLDDGTILTLPSPEASPALDSAPAPR